MAKEQDRDAGLQTRRARKPKEVDPLPELSGEPRPWTLGDRLAFLRRQRGFTQKQFSELVGKARATIIQYEQGRLQPPTSEKSRVTRGNSATSANPIVDCFNNGRALS